MPSPLDKKDEASAMPEDIAPAEISSGRAQSDVPAVNARLAAAELNEQPEEAEPEDQTEPPTAEPAAQQPSLPEDEDDTTPFDDEQTDEAIDEIVAKEGDDLLAVQDAAVGAGSVQFERKRSWFARFWRSKWTWWVIVLLLLGGVGTVAAVPKYRYWTLNTAGVRSSSSVVVIDGKTQLPLKGVTFQIGDHRAKTDGNGKAKLTGLELGPAQLMINQVGFEKVERNIVIGWGSNPLGNVPLSSTGIRYIIDVKDYLSDKPVAGAEATDGQSTAVAAPDGKITLTLDAALTADEQVSVSKPGYRTEEVTLTPDPEKAVKVALVPAKKSVFVSKQSGVYDVYKSDLDGKNQELLLRGTGNENSNVSLVVSPDGSRAAYVSTRDNKRDSSGFLLNSIMLINVENASTTTIAEAPQLQLTDWIGSRLVFLQASADSAASNRYTVVSYDYSTNTRLQLAAANQLSAVIGVQGVVYYAVDTDAANPSVQTGLFKIMPDGTGKQRIFEGELTTVLRSSYGSLNLQTNDGTWYSYDVANGTKSQIGAPSNLANRLYIDNDDHSKSLWINQGSLQSYDIATAKDTAIATQNGLAYPLRWVDATTALFRVSTSGETADYVASILGGGPHKVADVAAAYGFAQAQ